MCPITQMRPESGCISPAASFMTSVFPDPLSPRNTFVSPGMSSKVTPLKNVALIEANADVFEGQERFARNERAHFAHGRSAGQVHHSAIINGNADGSQGWFGGSRSGERPGALLERVQEEAWRGRSRK